MNCIGEKYVLISDFIGDIISLKVVKLQGKSIKNACFFYPFTEYFEYIVISTLVLIITRLGSPISFGVFIESSI